LTTLSGDDTESNVKRLCFKAKRPVRPDILEKLGCNNLKLTTGAVCVYPSRVAEAVKFLEVKATRPPLLQDRHPAPPLPRVPTQ
jgi:deoxyribose-phosphate aldolase